VNSRMHGKRIAAFLVCLFCVIAPGLARAAPGTLPSTPLFLTNAVEPNIFFTLDDSGSMEWELMVKNGTAGVSSSSGLPRLGNLFRYYVLPNFANGQDGFYSANFFPYTVPSVSLEPLAWIARNHQANTLYYNPDITYRAWQGSDSSGNPLYVDATPGNALGDPSNPSFGSINLTAQFNYRVYHNGAWKKDSLFPATYYEWVDSDADGIIESTDGHVEIQIKPANAPFPSGRSYAEEIQNFANWYQFYRKRSYIAKGAIGRVVNNSDATRMGLDIYNGGHQFDARSMTTPGDKSALLQNLYNNRIPCGPGKNNVYPNSCNGTPARRALDRVGRLFAGTTGNPSPIQSAATGGECQQNFNVLLSDGFWNGSTPANIGNADRDTSGVANNGFDGDSSESNDGGNYEDNFSVTLADVAMHYYETDLSPLSDKVPVQEGLDLAEHQHLVTYTIGFGLNGTLNPASDDPVAGGANFWPNPMDAENEERVDDLWHAAYNARGRYLSAQNPAELESSLLQAIQDISSRTATAAAVAVNSARLTSESIVYIAQFNSNRWLGSLLAYPIIDLDLGTLSDTPKWEAGELLTNRDLANDPRTIITFNGSSGVPFRWNKGALSTQMVDDLKTNPAGGTDSDAVGEARLNYLRGDRSNEGSGNRFRTRPGLLGDIVNSGPVYVGDATLAWPDFAPFPSTSGNKYSDFKNGVASTRKRMVYVGSNDGFLHAFDDSSGKELLAYAPNILASTESTRGFHYLTAPQYMHSWYVDLTPTISDVFMTTHVGSGWHTILVGSLRGGGRGIFALEVTNPDSFSEANAQNIVMWEFDSSVDSDLGYSYSRPTVALTNSGRWVAIFGNGYNDLGNGEATLYILDIEAGLNGWGPQDFTKISTKSGNTLNRNGLATPALADLDGNGTVDRVYAGDLNGNMWAFDLSSSQQSRWSVAYKTGSTPAPLFSTPGGQPITSKPVLAKHPTIPFQSSPSNSPNLMVYFGTGQYLVESDKTNTSVQSFYGVWDQGDSRLSRANLIEQTMNPAYSSRVLTSHFVDYSTDYGWWLDLPDSGERSVTNAIARGDTIFFNTFVPENNPCSVGGYGYRFSVDMTTGGSPSEPVVDFNKDGQIDQQDNEMLAGVRAAIRQEGYLPEPVFIEDLVFTGPIANKIRSLPISPEGRFAWQELIK
jgi:type IV pilus assembly protein PilY1